MIADQLALSENPRPAKAARRSETTQPVGADVEMAPEGQISLVAADGCNVDEFCQGDVLVASGGRDALCGAHHASEL